MQSLLRCVVIIFGLFAGMGCGNVFAPWGRSNADMRQVDPLEPEQVKSIKNVSEFQKLLSALQTKMKSIQTSMTKVEKKHRIEEETAFWMMFRYIISNLEYECDYFIRFTKELAGNMSKYERQARKEKVDETIINNVQLELNNFCCLGHKVNLACIRGVFAVMLQYIESNEEGIDEGEKAALEPIVSQKHLAIFSKNKDLYALVGNVVGKIPTFLDGLNAVSEALPKDGGTDEGYSEKFKLVTDSLENILIALQDAITYIRGSTKHDEIKSHREKLVGDLITNSQKLGMQSLKAAVTNSQPQATLAGSVSLAHAEDGESEDDEDQDDEASDEDESEDVEENAPKAAAPVKAQASTGNNSAPLVPKVATPIKAQASTSNNSAPPDPKTAPQTKNEESGDDDEGQDEGDDDSEDEGESDDAEEETPKAAAPVKAQASTSNNSTPPAPKTAPQTKNEESEADEGQDDGENDDENDAEDEEE